MPNWCYNELEVSGNTDSLKELQQLFENGFSLEKIAPTPPELTAIILFGRYHRVQVEQNLLILSCCMQCN